MNVTNAYDHIGCNLKPCMKIISKNFWEQENYKVFFVGSCRVQMVGVKKWKSRREGVNYFGIWRA